MPTAVACDLLTALLDSWSLWDDVAGDPDTGRRWRRTYLDRMYATGDYQPYESLVHAATADAGLPDELAATLLERWDELEPWPGVPEALAALKADGHRIGVVTNCSEALAARAVARLGVPVDVVVAAERAGAYKPDARPYALAVQELGAGAGRTVFLAGSPGDVTGAAGAGMPVIWHNHVGLPDRPEPPPAAEIRDVADLPVLVRGALSPG